MMPLVSRNVTYPPCSDFSSHLCLPISSIPPVEQRPFIRMMGGILKAKATDPSADTGKQETEIDLLAFKLHQLTPEEITIVEKQK